MTRPDQAKFDQFARQFEVIDSELQNFGDAYGYELVRNQNRQPCRILRKSDTMLQIIEISLDGDWLRMEFQEDLPCNVTIAAYYQPLRGRRLFKRSNIVKHQSFSVIKATLQETLHQSMEQLNSWSIPAIDEEDHNSIGDGWQRTRF